MSKIFTEQELKSILEKRGIKIETNPFSEAEIDFLIKLYEAMNDVAEMSFDKGFKQGFDICL